MCARRKRDRRFGLAAAEVEMVLVIRDRLVERRQIRVDQEVVVAAVGSVGACRRDAHSVQPEMDRGLWP